MAIEEPVSSLTQIKQHFAGSTHLEEAIWQIVNTCHMEWIIMQANNITKSGLLMPSWNYKKYHRTEVMSNPMIEGKGSWNKAILFSILKL